MMRTNFAAVLCFSTGCVNPSIKPVQDCAPPIAACEVNPVEQRERILSSGGQTFDHAWQALDGSWFGGQDSFRSCWQEVVLATKGWGMHGGLGANERIVLEDDETGSLARGVTYAEAVLSCKREAASMCGIQDCARARGIHDGPTYEIHP